MGSIVLKFSDESLDSLIRKVLGAIRCHEAAQTAVKITCECHNVGGQGCGTNGLERNNSLIDHGLNTGASNLDHSILSLSPVIDVVTGGKDDSVDDWPWECVGRECD